jgi:hypothetical protein
MKKLFFLEAARRYRFIGLTLLLLTLACVHFDFPNAPTPETVSTPIIWPTLRPRPTPPLLIIAGPKPACSIADLAVDQHLSAGGSYTETERLASTPMLCHIERNSCAYRQLVGILEPTIVFKQEEQEPYYTEDMVIHPAMIQPLSRLNELVKAEWGNTFRLRVTDAYDSLLEHDPPTSERSHRYSLHYEGRAIDITTWPVEPSLYGRLCALAHCAGFDWVHHEGTHCHASIKAPSLCFHCNE